MNVSQSDLQSKIFNPEVVKYFKVYWHTKYEYKTVEIEGLENVCEYINTLEEKNKEIGKILEIDVYQVIELSSQIFNLYKGA